MDNVKIKPNLYMYKIYESTPFRGDRNIGKAYNEFCKIVPSDGFILIRDSDTMYLQPNSQALIEQIVESDPPFDLIGCRTNRLRGSHQCVNGMFDERSIDSHIEAARLYMKSAGCQILETKQPIAGMFMLFRKSLWDHIKFDETAGRLTDKRFSADVIKSGGKLGVAQGLYLFHLYRWNSANPYDDIDHLI